MVITKWIWIVWKALPIMSDAEFLSTKNPDTLDGEDGETPIYEKYDNLLHGSRNKSSVFLF